MIRQLLIFAVSAVIAGCSSDDISDLEKYVAEVKARPKSPIEPLPEIKTIEPFIFVSENLRNPFVAIEKTQETDEAKVENGIRPDTARPREELESYELDSLRMVGTVDQNQMLWGLVKAVDGTIHRVKVGNHMGRNFGQIIRIKEDQIELLEIVPDSPGSWRERKAALDLAEASGERK
jgi:type IV pilus assembly protein PilP